MFLVECHSYPRLGAVVINADNNLITAAHIGRIIWIIQIIRRTTNTAKVEPECREGVGEQLERMKELCKERDRLYEKQNDLREKGRKLKGCWNNRNMGYGGGRAPWFLW